MDFSKLQSLKRVKVVTKTNNGNPKTKHTKLKTKVPRSIRSEVLLLYNGVFVEVDGNRYPLVFRDEDYLKAKYAFSSENNPHWDLHTLRSYTFNEKYLDKLKDYWWLVKSHLKVYINIDNGIAHLDIEKMNNKMLAIIKKYKPSYYADKRHPQV